jgi:carboxyl-terminal processing protease
MKNNLKYLPILIFATLALGFVLGGMLNFPVADFSNRKIIREASSINSSIL